MNIQIDMIDAQNLIKSNMDGVISKTGGTASGELATSNNPSSVAEASAVLPTNQGKLVRVFKRKICL